MSEVLPRSVYWLGLDLGLRRNPSALAVLEEETPYAEIPGVLGEYLRRLKPGFPVHLTVDASGVGAPVVELLERARLDAKLHPVVITGGEGVGKLPHAVTVPRWALLENVRVRLECRDVKLPKGLENLGALREELAALGTSQNHPDDLAMAVALALWGARPRKAVGERPEILPGAPVGENWRQRVAAEWLGGQSRR